MLVSQHLVAFTKNVPSCLYTNLAENINTILEYFRYQIKLLYNTTNMKQKKFW